MIDLLDRFLAEYWLFVEALLLRASEFSGVDLLNAYAASLGYPFGAALGLSALGCITALALLGAGRPGWGFAGLAVGEELSALSLATAALAHGAGALGPVALVRVAAAAIAVVLVCTLLRRALRPAHQTLRPARGRAPAAPGIPPAS